MRALFVLYVCTLVLSLYGNVVSAAESSGSSADFGQPTLAAEEAGADLYAVHCAQCHDTGVAKAVHPRMMGFLGPQAIVRAMTRGAMRTQAASLSAQQKIVLAEWLTGTPYTAEVAHPVEIGRAHV